MNRLGKLIIFTLFLFLSIGCTRQNIDYDMGKLYLNGLEIASEINMTLSPYSPRNVVYSSNDEVFDIYDYDPYLAKLGLKETHYNHYRFQNYGKNARDEKIITDEVGLDQEIYLVNSNELFNIFDSENEEKINLSKKYNKIEDFPVKIGDYSVGWKITEIRIYKNLTSYLIVFRKGNIYERINVFNYGRDIYDLEINIIVRHLSKSINDKR